MDNVSSILGADGKPYRRPRKEVLNAQHGYDVLRKEHENDHWKYATNLASSALDTYVVQRKIEKLARQEFRNNPHLNGLVRKMAHEVVGKGPTLEIIPNTITKSSMKAANRFEKFWNEHACEIDFTGKLRLGEIEKRVGGEGFNVFRRNPRISTLPIDFELYEGAQFHTPGYLYEHLHNRSEYPVIDGIVLDDWGNPRTYHRLRQHPHSMHAHSLIEIDNVDASVCVHEFRKDRPTQYRGVSECLAPLQIYAHIRRFIESKVGQEELRAKMLGVVQSKWLECADIGDEPIEMMIGDGQFLTLPDGWEAEMFRFDATGQGVTEFMRVALSWATMSFLVPWNVAASDSSDSNFASGRLDHLLWNRVVGDRQFEIEKKKINRYLAFFVEFAMLANRIPSGLGAFTHKWHWPEREPIDIKAQSVADKNYASVDLLDMDEFAQRRGSSAIDMMTRKMRLKFEKEKIKREMEQEYGFELPEAPQPQEEKDTDEPQEEAGQDSQQRAAVS